MTFLILTVCTANICRSPGIAAILRDRLKESRTGSEVHVISSGVRAREREGMCPHITEGVLPKDAAARALQVHIPRQLAPSQIDVAQLVVTADRSHRSAVVRMSPNAQARTFTLREAATLSSEVLARTRVPRHIDARDSMDWLVQEMNEVRGLAELPRAERYWSPLRSLRPLTVHPHDVPDSHGGDPAFPHRLVRQLSATATEQLAYSLLLVWRETTHIT